LAQALAVIGPGDTLLVTRLDRLARSTLQLLTVLDRLAGWRGSALCSARSLGDAWADTATPHGRLMLAVLGGLAEFERDLIKSRTAEGRRRAVARGVKMGPKFKLSAEQRRFVAEERAKGESVRHLARVLGVSKDTVGRVPPSKHDDPISELPVCPCWRAFHRKSHRPPPPGAPGSSHLGACLMVLALVRLEFDRHRSDEGIVAQPEMAELSAHNPRVRKPTIRCDRSCVVPNCLQKTT
jgi:hypothetical protein